MLRDIVKASDDTPKVEKEVVEGNYIGRINTDILPNNEF